MGKEVKEHKGCMKVYIPESHEEKAIGLLMFDIGLPYAISGSEDGKKAYNLSYDQRRYLKKESVFYKVLGNGIVF